MAFIQNVKFQEPPRYTFSLDDYSGGLNNISDIQRNQARNLLNMRFTDGLKMKKRLGIRYMNELSVPEADPDKVILFVDEYKPYFGANKMITATASKVYVDGIEVGVINGKPRGTSFKDNYFLVDGTNIYVWDGTDLKVMIDPPAFTPAPAPATLGVWNSNATQTWYEPCQAEIDDQFKGVNLIPKKPSLITSSAGRLYISGCEDDKNNVYISDIENAFYFPPTLPIQPDPNGEYVTSLNVFHEVLIVGRNESLFALYGNTNRTDTGNEFNFKHINSHTGIYSQETCKLMHDYMVYLGSDGIVYRMITPLTDVRRITSAVHSKTINFFEKPINLSKADMVGAHAMFWNNEYHLAMGGFIFVYNYDKLAWTIYDGIQSNYMKNIDDVPYICASDGYLYTFKSPNVNIFVTPPIAWDDNAIWDDELIWEPGAIDLNRPYSDTFMVAGEDVNVKIPAFWSSKRYDMEDPTRYKHFREMFVVTSTWKDFVSELSVRFEIDFVDVSNILEVKNQIAVFGRAVWGDRFINKDIASSIPTQIGRRGRYISFTIANDIIDQPMEVHEVAGDYILRGRR